MVKIQIELTDEEDKIVDVYKARNRIETKELAVKKMIESFAECKHDWERLEKRKYNISQVQSALYKTKAGSYMRIVERCKKCGVKREDDIKL